MPLTAPARPQTDDLVPRREKLDGTGPSYHVILLADNEHTRDYVAEMLAELFYIETLECQWLAEEVFLVGRAVVMTCEWSAAEFARVAIEAHGPDHRMPGSSGSMKAIVELAEAVDDFA